MPMNPRNALVYWAPIFVYLSLIFVFSSFSRLPLKRPAIAGIDKVAHFCEYGLLAILVARAAHSLSRPKALWVTWLVAVGVVLVFGSLDEWYQSTVPKRQSDVLDLTADVLGGMACSLIYLTAAGWRRRKKAAVAVLSPPTESPESGPGG